MYIHTSFGCLSARSAARAMATGDAAPVYVCVCVCVYIYSYSYTYIPVSDG